MLTTMPRRPLQCEVIIEMVTRRPRPAEKHCDERKYWDDDLETGIEVAVMLNLEMRNM